MNRKTFLASIGAMIATPFMSKPEPNELPRGRVVELADVEAFVREEIDRRLTTRISSRDLFYKVKIRG